MLTDFYTGFTSSPTEILILLGLLIAFVAVLAILAIRRERRERRRLIRRGEEAYRQEIATLPLTQRDEEALQSLARHLDRPERTYLILRNQAVFNACAHRALSNDEVGEGDLSAIRVKLGFTGEKTGETPESSVEIPSGVGVLLIESGKDPVAGQVLQPIPSAFKVRLDVSDRPFTSGDLVEVIYQNRSGVYRFESAVLGYSGNELSLSHSEEMSRVQRRRYYRREIAFPVYVRSAQGRDRPVRSQFVDIGGGGASLYNPENRFGAGDEVELTFHPDSTETLHVVGRVIRRSKRGTVIHVGFQQLRESARDKIFRGLFRKQPDRRA